MILQTMNYRSNFFFESRFITHSPLKIRVFFENHLVRAGHDYDLKTMRSSLATFAQRVFSEELTDFSSEKRLCILVAKCVKFGPSTMFQNALRCDVSGMKFYRNFLEHTVRSRILVRLRNLVILWFLLCNFLSKTWFFKLNFERTVRSSRNSRTCFQMSGLLTLQIGDLWTDFC